MTEDSADDVGSSRRRLGAPLALLLGAALGVLAMGLVRLALQPPPHVTHYHANWAVLVDGVRLDLSGDDFMEDVANCKVDPTEVAPEDRVHMHNNDADAVHVHDTGATWGHLLANVGFGIGDDYLVTHTGERLFATPERTLKFVLNGERVGSIRNLPIGRRDRLLISYGSEPLEEVVRTQFAQVATTAAALDASPDPAGCGGNAPHGLGERMRRAFWF